MPLRLKSVLLNMPVPKGFRHRTVLVERSVGRCLTSSGKTSLGIPAAARRRLNKFELAIYDSKFAYRRRLAFDDAEQHVLSVLNMF